MEKKTLFEIPIYAMSKKEFNKRWDKQKRPYMIHTLVMVILRKIRNIMYQNLVFHEVYGNIIKL